MKFSGFLLLLVLLLTACNTTGPEISLPPIESEVEELEFEEVLPARAIEVLDKPTTVSAGEAASYIGQYDEVMGITIEGESRAYPVGLMSRYEIANDTLGGQEVAVTFCAYCNTGISFLRTIETNVLHFEVSGKFLDNAMVMMDRETGSLWAQSRLEAVEGDLSGQTLALLTASQVPWQEWLNAHPDTTLVIDEQSSVAEANSGFVLPVLPSAGSDSGSDSVEMVADYVIGVSSEEEAWAFPIEEIEKASVVNEEIAGEAPFVLLALEPPGAIMAWQRTHEGRTLTFVEEHGSLKDQETGTIWNRESGQAEEGALEGAQLERFNVKLTHWLGWVDLHPESALWEGMALTPPTPLSQNVRGGSTGGN